MCIFVIPLAVKTWQCSQICGFTTFKHWSLTNRMKNVYICYSISCQNMAVLPNLWFHYFQTLIFNKQNENLHEVCIFVPFQSTGPRMLLWFSSSLILNFNKIPCPLWSSMEFCNLPSKKPSLTELTGSAVPLKILPIPSTSANTSPNKPFCFTAKLAKCNTTSAGTGT